MISSFWKNVTQHVGRNACLDYRYCTYLMLIAGSPTLHSRLVVNQKSSLRSLQEQSNLKLQLVAHLLDILLVHR